MAAAVKKTMIIVGDDSGRIWLQRVFQKIGKPRKMSNVFVDLGWYVKVDDRMIDFMGPKGKYEYKYMNSSAIYPGTNVVMMCFSIDSPDSLENIAKIWAPEVNHFCPGVPIILVGNKKDLRNDPSTIEKLALINREPVKFEEGRDMAERINAFDYLECSAMTEEGVEEVFETAVKASLQGNQAPKAKITMMPGVTIYE